MVLTERRGVQITAPRLRTAEFSIRGTAPYVQARFGSKAMAIMRGKMLAGSQAKKGKARDPRNFDDDYEQAKHVGLDGEPGIPASAFRNAMISACRLVGFKMTLAKLSIFVKADAFDRADGLPLVHISGTPEPMEMATRNATGIADIRVRPMWREWSADVRIVFDEDQFSLEDVTNLLHRVGVQVGIGEGRPDSKQTAGLGWGTFELVNT